MTASRVALVTGAGSGIGRAIAIAFSQAGYCLALVGRREANLRETAALTGLPALVHAADIASADAARGAVRACVQHFGRLDVLINNAGVGKVVSISETSDWLLDETYRINAFAPAWMTLEAWPTLQRQHHSTGRGGCVINISSMASIDPFPGFFAYAGSKAAASIMAASIAKEGAAIGVRAFALAPGAVETDMLRASFDEQAISREQTLAPQHVANIALACAAGTHDALNGRNIPVLPQAFHAWYQQFLHDQPAVAPL
jgi:NAD(P)-dependent dehydrogenase (short-subunit alcohol dehydrogenase family)